MTLKERYLEENIIKTIDRAINQEDYQKLKDELQLYRGQARLLAPEIEKMQEQYNSIKNSPQGPALKLALDAKTQELQNATDTLDMYKDQGRHALDTEVKDYQLGKAKSQGLLQGAGVGGLAGLAGGLAAGQSAFGESTETFAGRVLEEAGYDMNKIKTSINKPKPFDLKSIPTPSFGEKVTNKLNKKIGDIGHGIDQKAKTKFGSANVDKFKSKISSGVSSGFGKATNIIDRMNEPMYKHKDQLFSSEPIKKVGNIVGSAAMGSPLTAAGLGAGLGAGALGLGAMGLSHLFGDGEDLPEGVEGAPEGTDETIPEGPQPAPVVTPSMFDNFPGGKLGAGAAGLGAAGLAGLAYDRNKRR